MPRTQDSSKQFIKELKERDSVASVFMASDKSILVDRNGKTYMSINLTDSSGSINARIWDKVEERVDSFDSGDFVFVKGFVQSFQNRRQIVVHEIGRATKESVSLKDFIQGDVEPPEKMLEQLDQIVATIEDKAIKSLVEVTLADAEVRNLMMRAPAAKSIHHAYMGGLLEHILSICRVMNGLASHYKFLDRDLLLFGAIFHDIGKLWELTFEGGIRYTDRGRLVGHMVLACELIDRMSPAVPEMTVETRDILKHIVLSHHGKLEHGSPKEPALPEAMVVAMIDDLDSKLNTLMGFMRQELQAGEKWTRLSSHFNRYFFLGRMLDKDAPTE